MSNYCDCSSFPGKLFEVDNLENPVHVVCGKPMKPVTKQVCDDASKSEISELSAKCAELSSVKDNLSEAKRVMEKMGEALISARKGLQLLYEEIGSDPINSRLTIHGQADDLYEVIEALALYNEWRKNNGV